MARLSPFFLLLAWSYLGSAFLTSQWQFHGPFPVGKTELDGDPTASQGGPVQLLKRGPKASTPSELVAGGHVQGWQTIHADTNGVVSVQPRGVDWNRLVQTMSEMSILEFQGWVVGTIKTPSKVYARVHCSGVVSAFVQLAGSATLIPVQGDIYNSGWVATSLTLPPGTHKLLVWLKAKVSGQFQCTVKESTPGGSGTSPLVISTSPVSPDLVSGKPFFKGWVVAEKEMGSGGYLSVVVTNLGESWVENVTCVSTLSQPLPLSLSRIPPGGVLVLPCHFALPSKPSCPATPGEGASVPLSLRVSGALCTSPGGQQSTCTATTSPPYPIQLRCRYPGQSFLMTYLDHDNSVASAGVLHPINAPTLPSPILLSFHGTGVSGTSQVESYKRKPRGAGDGTPYTFGLAEYWVLAPDRHGAHNHQGVGLWSAFAALEALERASGGAADASRVVFAGHSMGGGGAWGGVLAAPHLAIAAAPSAGWLVKEGYSDANLFMRLDVGEPFIHPSLASVLLSTVRDQRYDSYPHALVGIPTHIRVGSEDPTVPAFYSRRMGRLLVEAGAGGAPEATGSSGSPILDEVTQVYGEGKPEHWWWDTLYPNDGGIMADDTMRGFFSSHSGRGSSASLGVGGVGKPPTRATSTLPSKFTVVCANPRTHWGGRGGWSIISGGGGGELDIELLDSSSSWSNSGAALERVWKWVGTRGDVTRVRLMLPWGVGVSAVKDEVGAGAGGQCVSQVGTLAPPSTTISTAPQALCIPGGLRVQLTASTLPTSPTILHFCRATPATLAWRVCYESTQGVEGDEWAFERFERGPHTAAPARTVTASPFLIVVGTGGGANVTQAYLRVATFISQGHALSAHATAPIALDTQLVAAGGIPCGFNAILIGSPAHNSITAQLVAAPTTAGAAAGVKSTGEMGDFDVVEGGFPPLTFARNGSSFTLGSRVWGAGHSLITTLPFFKEECVGWGRTKGSLFSPLDTSSAIRARLALLIAPTFTHPGDALLKDLHLVVRAATSTIPPMVRAPFSNLFPDFVVLGERVLVKGWGGVEAAGFFNSTWGISASSYFRDTSPP